MKADLAQHMMDKIQIKNEGFCDVYEVDIYVFTPDELHKYVRELLDDHYSRGESID